MKQVAWMVGACFGSWAAAAAAVDRPARIAALFGMLGPLAAASVSWVAAERVWRRDPARLTAVMVAGFAGKLVFFGAWVAIALAVLALRPVPFVVSFTGYFIGLYAMEALSLRRLFAGRAT